MRIKNRRTMTTFQASPIRIPHSAIKLALPLFVFRVRADHSHHAFAVDDLAVVAHLLN
jgi:hypothetical protein